MTVFQSSIQQENLKSEWQSSNIIINNFKSLCDYHSKKELSLGLKQTHTETIPIVLYLKCFDIKICSQNQSRCPDQLLIRVTFEAVLFFAGKVYNTLISNFQSKTCASAFLEQPISSYSFYIFPIPAVSQCIINEIIVELE